MNLKCTKCNYPDEDNTLEIFIAQTTVYRFKQYDNDLICEEAEPCESNMYLECPICGQRYEFENNDKYIAEERLILGTYNHYDFKKLDIKNLKLK